MYKTNRLNNDAVVMVELLKPVERHELRPVLRQLVKLELRIVPDNLPDELLAGLVDGERKVGLCLQPRPESCTRKGAV